VAYPLLDEMKVIDLRWPWRSLTTSTVSYPSDFYDQKYHLICKPNKPTYRRKNVLCNVKWLSWSVRGLHSDPYYFRIADETDGWLCRGINWHTAVVAGATMGSVAWRLLLMPLLLGWRVALSVCRRYMSNSERNGGLRGWSLIHYCCHWSVTSKLPYLILALILASSL